MPKRFYLATQKDRAAQAAELLNALQAGGWERTFDWSDQTDGRPEAYSEIATAELAGVLEADVVVVLMPGGRGTHVEIGAALALGKPVILWAPDRETLEIPYPCVFHYHPGVKLLISEILDVTAVLSAMAVGRALQT